MAPQNSGATTILLVEDEASLRNLLRIILSQRGYHVLEAEDGEKALALAKQHRGPIHLLLTDALLPHLNGYRLAAHLRQEHPETRVLYVSGYLDGELVARCRTDPGCQFLQKPFTPAELIAKVNEALRGGQVAGGAH